MASSLWIEFGSLALAHALAVASPGPDFALMLRQSLRYGRPTALRTAWGIGCGISVHVAVALFGFGLVIRTTPGAFTVLKVLGAGYLLWLGARALLSQGSPDLDADAGETSTTPQRGAWRRGFMTNALNPKAALFFITLYAVLVSPETPRWVQGLYGLWLAGWTVAWFTLVGIFFTQPKLRAAYGRAAVWVDRCLGLVFIGFALNLLWAELG